MATQFGGIIGIWEKEPFITVAKGQSRGTVV